MLRYSRTRSCSSFSSGYCRSTDSSRSCGLLVVVPLQRLEAALVERDRFEIGRSRRCGARGADAVAAGAAGAAVRELDRARTRVGECLTGAFVDFGAGRRCLAINAARIAERSRWKRGVR